MPRSTSTAHTILALVCTLQCFDGNKYNYPCGAPAPPFSVGTGPPSLTLAHANRNLPNHSHVPIGNCKMHTNRQLPNDSKSLQSALVETKPACTLQGSMGTLQEPAPASMHPFIAQPSLNQTRVEPQSKYGIMGSTALPSANTHNS
jgi:hypothetical protein